MFASSYPVFSVFISTFYLALLLFWVVLVWHIMADIFRSHDLSGAQKTAWVFVLFVLPMLGCLAYVFIRGGSMHERSIAASQLQQRAFEDYIRKVANSKE